MAIPFDAFSMFPISVIVLLLIVMLPVEVNPELITAIPWSRISVIVLPVTSSVKSSTGVARIKAEPPLSDIVLVDAVTSRVVISPLVWK